MMRHGLFQPLGWLGMAGLLLGLALSPACGDVIHLTNGRKFEGVILSETEDTVVIRSDIGTMTLARTRIQRIDRAAFESAQPLDPRAPENAKAPKEFEGFGSVVRDLDRRLPLAREAMAETRRLEKQIPELQKRYQALNDETDTWRARYQQLAAESQVKTPAMIQVEAVVQRLQQEANEAAMSYQARLLELGRKQEQVKAYIDSATQVAGIFYTARTAFRETYGPDASRVYFEELETRLSRHGIGVRDLEVPFEKVGSHLVANCKVNGQGTVRLLVDTGATLVTLSREAAVRLGLEIPSETQTFRLADGRTRDYPVMHLATLAVGEAQAEKVPAAIGDSLAGQGVDGLLGMSFLGRFGITYEPTTGMMHLRTIEAHPVLE